MVMANTMMGMKGRFLCNIKSGKLHFCCIYYWCLSQKAHKHFNIFHFQHKAVSTLKLSHPSLPGPSPVDGEERFHDQSVAWIRSSFVIWIIVHREVTNEPGQRTKSGQRFSEHYRYGPCQHGTALFMKHQGISQISVSPCCRDTHL